MENPFKLLQERLDNIEAMLFKLNHQQVTHEVAEQSDRCDSEEARQFCKEQGCKMSKSKFYKETAAGIIPCKRFGRRLVFSRSQLLQWIEEQTVEKDRSKSAYQILAASARRKEKGGKR